jgi:uncharacterized membrane protein
LTLIDTLMFVHIAAGLGALALGPAAMLAKPKGGARHRQFGRWYVVLMGVLAVTAGVLLVFRWNPFFFALSVFSFYLAFSGWRVLRRKRPWLGERAAAGDWAAAFAVLATAGASGWLRRAGVFGDDVAFVLGTLGFAVLAAVYDLWRFTHADRADARPGVWLLDHLTKIVGSYLAVASAFSATVLTAFLPDVLAQTWPALVGVPPLLYVANQYWRKMKPKGPTPP